VSGEAEEASQQKIDVVQRAYDLLEDAFELGRAGRWDEANRLPGWDLLDPDVVLEEVAEIPDSDTYRGIEGIRSWIRAGTETFEDVRWERREFAVRGPHVLVDVRGHFLGAGSGVETELEVTHVFTFRGGRMIRVAGYLDRAKAFEAVEASE
jgi:ketosteroid isomerase-like protein